VNIWQSYKQKRGCLVHFFRLLAVCWPGSSGARVTGTASCFDTLPACDGQIDRQTDGQTHDDSKYRASIASRGKTRGVFDVDCVYGNYVMHWSVAQNFLFLYHDRI